MKTYFKQAGFKRPTTVTGSLVIRNINDGVTVGTMNVVNSLASVAETQAVF